MLVSSLQPVAMSSDVFVVMFVVDAIGDHIVEAYSSISLVTAWYVISNVSCVCPTWSKRRL